MEFQLGDLVRLSELGESRMKKVRSKTGKVVGVGRSTGTIRVLFDGAKNAVSIHQTYLALVKRR